MKNIIFILTFCISLLQAEYYYSGGEVHFLSKIDYYDKKFKSRHNNTKEDLLLFQDSNNKIVGVNSEIIIGYNNIELKNLIEKEYKLKILKKLKPNVFLYSVEDKKLSLDITNRLYQLEAVRFAHPNFIKKREKRTADPLFDKAWHLENRGDNPTTEILKKGADINVTAAWNVTKGNGIKVGILDDAIDIRHEDLKENIVEYKNYLDRYTDDPSPTSRAGNIQGDWHGTACSGLILARENDKGSVGVAPEAKLYPIKYADDIASTVEAFYWLDSKGVDVVSNSWGTYFLSDALADTFKDLSKNGRDGKGMIILFASGNDSQNLDEYGINDESESPYVIGIGATSGMDMVTSYSNYGSALDFVAPGGEDWSLTTTDVTGNRGYKIGNYTYDFTGTSASAPIAAGVVTLILSANPDLTRDEVIEILKETSDKVGDKKYINGRNNYYGYGRINAGKAVQRALSLKLKSKINVLNPPSDLKFSDIKETSVTLTWKDNSDFESGFKIFRDNKLIFTTDKDIETFTDDGLEPGRTYTYTVKATTDD